MEIYKLIPAAKSYVWGGRKLKEKYGKESNGDTIAETWELSVHPDGVSTLSDGRKLTDLPESFFGDNVRNRGFFPVLIKFIDAAAPLSVQVHPKDEYAIKNENSLGKTETWYVAEADEGAGIYLGLKEDTDAKTFLAAIESGKVEKLLNFYRVKAGESYFIPAGTVHAIGKGCLMLEIQQNSNLTYRVYDYDRTDANGNKRPLHVEKALAVTDFKKFSPVSGCGNAVGRSKYFTAIGYSVADKTFFADERSFACVSCVKGAGKIEGRDLCLGDSYFIPAGYGDYRIEGDCDIVITTVRKYALGFAEVSGKIFGGLVSDDGNIVAKASADIEGENARTVIEKLETRLLLKAGMNASDVLGKGSITCEKGGESTKCVSEELIIKAAASQLN
ncbi:MAG: class I mannose-6-phosphate isomerase [Clostridia bacterium]|nr:class I mannose-6-phosphate isomerase [Clostridia bacterium]